MNRLARGAVGLVATIAVGLGVAPPAGGVWPEVRRRSPRATATLALATAANGSFEAAIDYGAPTLGGRRIFGDLVPFDQMWRAGDDEATTLTLGAPLQLGGARLEAGRYALFVLPRAPGSAQPWLLVVNAVADQWGAFNHDPSHDVARIPLQVDPPRPPLERLEFRWELVSESGGRLWLAWETVAASVGFELVAAQPLVSSSSTSKTRVALGGMTPG